MRRVSVAFALIVASHATSLAEFAPDLDAVCEPSPVTARSKSTVVPEKFVWDLFLAKGLSPKKLGIRATNGYLNEMYAAVLAADYCGNHVCEKDAPDKLRRVKLDLLRFLDTHWQRPKETGFWVTPRLTEGNRRELTAAFLNGTNDIQVACIGAAVDDGAKAPVAPKLSVLDGVRIRKDPLGLTVAQRLSNGKINPAFKKIDSASFTASRDYLTHTNTFNVDVVVGYAFGPHQFRKERLDYAEVIPYFRFSRQSVQSNDPDATDVRNISGGVVSSFYLTGVDGRIFNFAYHPEYTHSNRTGANILTQNFSLTPDLPWPGFGGRQGLYPGAPVSFAASVQGIGVYGNVLNDGGDVTLRESKEFEHLGGKGQIWFYGDESLFKGWSLSAAYQFLKVMRGPLYAIRRFETTLSYTLPDSEFWSLNLTYINGRNLQTFEEQQQITLGLGLKY
jgi:hypothetical protein